MSTTTNFFIETKDKETGKWKLLTAYIPFKPKSDQHYSYKEQQWIKEDARPDAVTIDGLELERYSGYLWQQGHVRDMFTHSLSQADFIDRGLPDDISEGAKEWFDNALAKEEEQNKEYFEVYGEKRFWGGKWWYSETYVTLQELEDEYDKQYKDWCERLKKAFKGKYLDSVLMKKMDEVIATVKGTKPKRKKSEDEECYNEDITYMLEEEIYDLLQLWSFKNNIDTLVECLTGEYYTSSNIRVIAYSS